MMCWCFLQPVTFDIMYLTVKNPMSESSSSTTPDDYLPYLLGRVCGLGASIVLSAWILIGVVYLAVLMRRDLWKRARLEDDYIM